MAITPMQSDYLSVPCLLVSGTESSVHSTMLDYGRSYSDQHLPRPRPVRFPRQNVLQALVHSKTKSRQIMGAGTVIRGATVTSVHSTTCGRARTPGEEFTQPRPMQRSCKWRAGRRKQNRSFGTTSKSTVEKLGTRRHSFSRTGARRNGTTCTQAELAHNLIQQGRLLEAEVILRDAIAGALKSQGRDSKVTAVLTTAFSELLLERGRPSETASLLNQVISIYDRLNTPRDSRRRAAAQYLLAASDMLQGD